MCLEFFHIGLDQIPSIILNIFQLARVAELQMYFGKSMKWLSN